MDAGFRLKILRNQGNLSNSRWSANANLLRRPRRARGGLSKQRERQGEAVGNPSCHRCLRCFGTEGPDQKNAGAASFYDPPLPTPALPHLTPCPGLRLELGLVGD